MRDDHRDGRAHPQPPVMGAGGRDASITPKRNQRALDYISEVLGGSVASVEQA
ncbi:MAG: hypothetical protein ACREPZ_05710 [Rhodanobacteraceae bacterium]